MTEPFRPTHYYLRSIAHIDLRFLRKAMAEAEGFDAKFAVILTRGVGTMACAYAFGLLALVSLPSAIRSGDAVTIVSWISQTFLQLVLLSVIMVGQGVQGQAADERSAKTFDDTEKVLDRLDEHTEGGIKTVLDKLAEINGKLPAPSGNA